MPLAWCVVTVLAGHCVVLSCLMCIPQRATEAEEDAISTDAVVRGSGVARQAAFDPATVAEALKQGYSSASQELRNWTVKNGQGHVLLQRNLLPHYWMAVASCHHVTYHSIYYKGDSGE